MRKAPQLLDKERRSSLLTLAIREFNLESFQLAGAGSSWKVESIMGALKKADPRAVDLSHNKFHFSPKSSQLFEMVTVSSSDIRRDISTLLSHFKIST